MEKAEVTEITLVMTEAILDAEAISDKGLMIEIEEDTLLSGANLDISNNSRGSFRRLDN